MKKKIIKFDPFYRFPLKLICQNLNPKTFYRLDVTRNIINFNVFKVHRDAIHKFL